MKILFIGDIVGSPGRRAVRELVPGLRERHGLDFVVANGENSAGGSGITAAIAAELFGQGVDVLTCGDHLWDQKDVAHLMRSEPRFVRPGNYPPGTPGSGIHIRRRDGRALLAVMNAQGRTFMGDIDCPFQWVEREIDALRRETPVILMDFHAEATSEKIAFGRLLDGRVSLVVGTHTHVQTADEQIFPGGTGFLCDAGFTGAQESVIGRKIEPVIRRFLTGQPQRFEVAREKVRLQGVWVEVDPVTGKCLAIGRVNEALPETPSPGGSMEG